MDRRPVGREHVLGLVEHMTAPLDFAVVADDSPLSLYFGDDLTNAVPANCDSSYTPTVDDIVRVEIRPRGNLPFVIGKVT